MVLASLVSCGKDNKVASPAAASNTVTNPIVTGNVSAQDLVNKINNPSTGFGTGILYVNTANAETCKVKWIFTICTASSSSANQTTISWNEIAAKSDLTYRFAYLSGNTNSLSKSYLHSSVVIATKQAELVDLLNRATAIYQSGTSYTVIVSGSSYIIDTKFPIQANPARTATDYFYNAI